MGRGEWCLMPFIAEVTDNEDTDGDKNSDERQEKYIRGCEDTTNADEPD